MIKTSVSTIKSIVFAAVRAAILLWTIERFLIYGYVAHLYLYPIPASDIEVVKISKPDPILIFAEPEIITEATTIKVTKVRDELTQDQLRRIHLEEAGATGTFISVGREGVDDEEGEEEPLVYRSSRGGLKPLASQYQSLTNTLRGKMQDLEENLTSLHNILGDYQREAYSPAYTSLLHNAARENTTMDRADIIDAANRDALLWIYNSNNTNIHIQSDTQNTFIRKIIQNYKDGIYTPHQVKIHLQIYLEAISLTARNTLTNTWEQLNKAHAIALDRKATNNNDQANKHEAHTTGRKRMATKQDLDEYTTHILKSIRSRMEEYYMVLLPNTEEGAFLQDGFQRELELYRDTSYGAVVLGAEDRRDGLVQKLKERYQENTRILLGDGHDTCVTETQVQSMVDEGIDAIFRQKELRKVMLNTVTNLFMTDDDDTDEYRRQYAIVEESMSEIKQSNDITNGGDGSVGVSSWAHANSLRTIVLENPLFPQVLDQLNLVVEKVEGYNDMVDQLIDYIVGDESEGRTFGSTVGDVMKEALGAVPAPLTFDEMKQKAGILHFNQV